MDDFLKELKQTIVELRFASGWQEIEMWHKVGEIINNSTAKGSDIKETAEALNEDEKDLWNAILFYKRYPDINSFTSGKNVSWQKICEEL